MTLSSIDNLLVWFLLLLAGLFALSLISLPTLIAYYINRWLTKKGFKYIGIVLLIIAPLWTVYSVYTAIYPTDSFYLEEFKEVTLRKAPKTAKVISKTASYPDFHGDYCSASLIKLSKNDYIDLIKELSYDIRLQKDGFPIGSSELDKVLENIKPEQIRLGFTRQIPEEEDHYLYIGFLDDQQTIIVYIRVS
jgi:energy-coupling factor transporter transmembrane protein EcfT